MADFKKFFYLLGHNEGGYVSKEEAEAKHDSGGETYKGVAREKHPDWPGWHLIDSYKPQATFPGILSRDATLQDMVVTFYKANFWDVLHGDDIANQSVANYIADWGANAGPSVPVKHVQRILGLDDDGIIGKDTLAAINAADPHELFTKLLDDRQQFYQDVVKDHPEKGVNLKGWLARAKSFEFTA